MDNDREEDKYDNDDYEEGYYKNDVAGDDEEMRTDHKEDETIYSKEEHEVRLNRPLTYDNNRTWLMKIRTGKHKGKFKKKKRTVCLLICWCMVCCFGWNLWYEAFEQPTYNIPNSILEIWSTTFKRPFVSEALITDTKSRNSDVQLLELMNIVPLQMDSYKDENMPQDDRPQVDEEVVLDSDNEAQESIPVCEIVQSSCDEERKQDDERFKAA